MLLWVSVLALAVVSACDGSVGPGAALESMDDPVRTGSDAQAPRASMEAGADGGRLELGEASIDVPPLALEGAQEIGIRVVQAPVPLPEGMAAAGEVYEITPHGLSFSVPITVRLPFEGEVDATLALKRLSDPQDTSWESAQVMGFAGGVATFELSSLSYYVVVRRCPQLQDTLEPAVVRTQGCGQRECGLWIADVPACGSCGSCGSGERCSADGMCEPLDAGVVDAGEADASTLDAGSADAGAADGGALDAGTADAGEADAGVVVEPPEPSASFTLLAGNPGNGGRYDIEDLDGDPATRQARLFMGQGVSYDASDGSFYLMGFQTIGRYTPADGNFELIAGAPWPQGTAGYVNGDASVSQLGQPAGNLILGDHLYFADNPAYSIRRMNLRTRVVDTFVGPTGSQGAGYTDGVGSGVRFRFRGNSAWESDLATDGNFLYVADSDNHAIRRVDLGVLPGGVAGEVITIAGTPPPTRQQGYVDGVGLDARFHYPYSIAYDPTLNLLMVGDGCNQRTRRIDLPADPRSATYLDEVVVSTVSGSGTARVEDGLGTAASHGNCSLRGGALIVDGKFIVSEGTVIREVEIATGQVTTVVGSYPDVSVSGQTDGIGLDARLLRSGGTFTYDGSHVYFNDYYTFRRFDPLTYEVETLIGPAEDWNLKADGLPGDSRFGGTAVVVQGSYDGQSVLLLEGNAGLRRLDLSTGQLTTLSGPAVSERSFVDGSGDAARIGSLIDGAVQVGPDIYFSDRSNCAIRVVTPDFEQPENSVTRTIVGGPPPTADCRTLEGIGTAARLHQPSALVHDDGMLYINSLGGHVLHALDLATLELTTIAGDGSEGLVDGIGQQASFTRPWAMAQAHDGSLYVTGSGVSQIRRVDPSTGEVSTVAGDPTGEESAYRDGIGFEARMEFIREMWPSSDGRRIYFLESTNLRVLDVDTLEVSTIFRGDGARDYPVSAPTPFSARITFRTFYPLGERSFLIHQSSHGNMLRLDLP